MTNSSPSPLSRVSQWKALRTTNALERINEEFRRRTKTQASLPNEEAVLFLLFGLLRSGQVTLRRLVGWQRSDYSQIAGGGVSDTNTSQLLSSSMADA